MEYEKTLSIYKWAKNFNPRDYYNTSRDIVERQNNLGLITEEEYNYKLNQISISLDNIMKDNEKLIAFIESGGEEQ